MRRIESYRVEGMEIYSTTLWHLQKDVALSALAKDLTDMDKNCPEVLFHLLRFYSGELFTMISVGNTACFCRPGVSQETASVSRGSTTLPSSSSREPSR